LDIVGKTPKSKMPLYKSLRIVQPRPHYWECLSSKSCFQMLIREKEERIELMISLTWPAIIAGCCVDGTERRQWLMTLLEGFK
jgi:hypothetical protein